LIGKCLIRYALYMEYINSNRIEAGDDSSTHEILH